jgi:hypothetical protein
MAEWKKSSKLSRKQLDDVADFVATFAVIPADTSPEEWLNTPGVADHSGITPYQKECGQCHATPGFTDGGMRDAPDLFAWGSPQWTDRVIKKPGVSTLYGFLEPKDQMPPFADQLTPTDIETIVRFLKNDYPGAPGSAGASSKP